MTSQTREEAAPSQPLAQVIACLEAARVHRFGDLDLARRDARKGLELLHALQTPEARYEDEEAELQVILANADRVEGRIDSAVIQCHAALKLIQGRPASRAACEAWNSLGWAYAQSGEFASSVRYTMRGLKLSRELGETEWESHALDVLGTVYAIFGDSVEALRHLDEAARIAKETGDAKRLCSVLNNLAMTRLGREEYAPALESALESLRLARECTLTVSEPNIVDTVASVLTAMGRFPEAEGYLVPTIADARRRVPNKSLANLLNNLGMVRVASGDPLEAESLHREALDISARIGDPVLEMRCHKLLADLYAAGSRWREAYDAFRKYHDLNQSVAGAKAAKRLTVTRIAGEIDALRDAADTPDSPAGSPSAVGALEALTARLRARNQELAEAKRAAEAASETKTRFLATMSHELKTPLNGVLGMAHLLSGTPLNDAQARYCRAIVTSGRVLNELVTDILDYSNVEAGRLDPETVEVDPAQVVDEVVQSRQAAAAARGLSVVIQVDDRIPKGLRGDPGRIRRVLQHVVGNAIKFTKEGAIEVRVSPLEAREGDPRAWIRFAVRDTGIGIGPEAAAGLFEPFVQADSSPTRPFGGSGLGLAISRRLVESMGGAMDFRSEPGLGSEFWFDLPFPLPVK
ncbi:MAG: tetratricopeptide repeat protein [Betaproteobacteria bacterium]|nr:tetratricopeptide repeat protein [Betaproteobacteria bacterium]